MSERGLATTIKEFLSQDWLGVVGLVIGVAGLWYAFYVRQRPRLAAQVNSLELVGSSPALPKDLELLFRGEKVPKVTLSRVAIWNMGNVTLRREQIVAADPLRLVTSSGSKVLDARIIVRIREVNDFSCSIRESGNEVECTFDYLDTDDGALIELIHTGDDKVQVVGTLREVPKGVRVFGVVKSQEKTQAHPSRVAAGLFGGLFLAGGITTFLVIAFDLESPPSMLFLAGLFGVTFIGLGSLFLWSLRGIAPKNLSTRITSGAAPSTRLPWHRRLYRRRNRD